MEIEMQELDAAPAFPPPRNQAPRQAGDEAAPPQNQAPAEEAREVEIEMQELDASPAFPPPQNQASAPGEAGDEAREADNMCAIVGGDCGGFVLMTSFTIIIGVILVLSEVQTQIFEQLASNPGLGKEDVKEVKRSTIYMTYGSIVAMVASFIVEHIYVYHIVGAAVIANEDDPPRIRWRRCLLTTLCVFWAFIAVGLVLFSIVIYHLHHPNLHHLRQHLSLYFSIISVFEIVILIMTICLHIVAVRLRSIILARSWIDTCPLIVVEAEGLGECSICYEPWAVGDIIRELPCEHSFHRHCIEDWFKVTLLTPRCPYCRQAV